jgi:hypothetical protein
MQSIYTKYASIKILIFLDHFFFILFGAQVVLLWIYYGHT